MNILSFDTTNGLASVAVMRHEQLLAYLITKENSSQAEQLFKLIDQALIQANLKLEDINLISLTNGPGSFTGVRVGIAAALGLQMTMKCSFIALSNFQVLAFAAQEFYPNAAITVALDARRGQVYYQDFLSDLTVASEAKLIDSCDIVSHNIIIGDGAKTESELSCAANAAMLAKASKYFFDLGLYSELKPLYIREPDFKIYP